MHVNEAMSTDVKIASPDQTIKEAASLMAEIDAGILPVGDNDRLVGMITDRDIAIRGVAKGLKPDAKVRDVMSKEVMYCFEDQDIEDVALNMADLKVRRLPVLNREKRLVGILSLGDIAMADGPDFGGRGDLRHFRARRDAFAKRRRPGLNAMTALTREDVVAALGRVDDVTIAEIIATGTTRKELAEAQAWIANDDLLLSSGHPRAVGRVGQLVDILAAMQEDDEALLERSAR